MHIPDNYLSPSTCAVMGTIMLPIWKHCITKVKKEISKKKLPTLGVCAAFSFLVMMFNLPAPGGTTAHAVGAVLIALILGPYAATIAVTIALLLQALFFGDGGILAFGANSFNMAFVIPFVGYNIFKFFKGRVKSSKGEYIGAFLGSYIGLVAGAACAAIELGIQPLLFKDNLGYPLYFPYPLKVSITAMVSIHLLIGIVEGLITVGVYAYVKKVSPEVIQTDGYIKSQEKNKKIKAKYFIIPMIVMIILTPLGLLAPGTAWAEWGSDQLKSLVGFIPKGISKGIQYNAIASDYGFNGINEVGGYILSAIIGVSILILVFKVLASMKKE